MDVIGAPYHLPEPAEKLGFLDGATLVHDSEGLDGPVQHILKLYKLLVHGFPPLALHFLEFGYTHEPLVHVSYEA